MGCCSIELSLTNLILLGGLIYAVMKAIEYFKKKKMEEMLERWSGLNIPRDKVILHTFGRCKTMPSIALYGMKLETYLRMAKIPYELDTKDPFGPKGKMPWITLNGTHVADTHFCIQYLNKKFEVNLNGKYTPEQLAVARACRLMLEEHIQWGMGYYRLVENISNFGQLMKIPLPAIGKVLMMPYHKCKTLKRLEAIGIGLHSRSEIYQITEDSLRALSHILGNKKFICGDEPCEEDAAIFGIVSQNVWAMHGSSYEKLVHGELSNLKDYCERMKDRFWPDWESCIDRS